MYLLISKVSNIKQNKDNAFAIANEAIITEREIGGNNSTLCSLCLNSY